MNPSQPTLNDLFSDAFARYLAVRPFGILFPHGRLCSSLPVKILACRTARTLYQDKKPVCRSLDGIQSIQENRACASCLLRKTCTPQLHLELLVNGVPYRLLLAYTSARNFMLFASRLKNQNQPIENAPAIISVLDRGRWGELRFSSPPAQTVPVDNQPEANRKNESQEVRPHDELALYPER